MSCPDWKTLAAWRDDPRAEEPAEWNEAIHHLDRGCSVCRRDAYAADPTLVFRRLAAVPQPAAMEESSEVDAMRQAVAAMRVASRVEAVERRGRALNWKRWAAAAALAIAALSMPGDDARHRRESPVLLPVAMPVDFPLGSREAAITLPAGLGDDPTLEGVVNRPDARVYQMEGEGLSVTMIVDESFDV